MHWSLESLDVAVSFFKQLLTLQLVIRFCPRIHVYISLIVGAGALSMPEAFSSAGWLTGTAQVVFLDYYQNSSFLDREELAHHQWTVFSKQERKKYRSFLTCTMTSHSIRLG